MISFSCNNCGKGFRVPGDKGGKTAKCPGCGHLLQVPIANNAPRPIDVRRPGDPPSRPSEKPSPRRRHHISPEEHARAKLAGRQRANLILLGVILLIGFLMSVIKIEGALRTRSVELANITILTQDSAPMSLKVLCLIPGVAGVGLLVDAAGGDRYEARRYSQGCGTHLSAGLLLDGAGDDVYQLWGVGQGCGHDLAVGILTDRTGDDHYTGDWLCMGAGSANGVGILEDAAGNDAYESERLDTMGYGSLSRDHESIGLFVDRDGADRYVGPGKNGSIWTNGSSGVGLDLPVH